MKSRELGDGGIPCTGRTSAHFRGTPGAFLLRSRPLSNSPRNSRGRVRHIFAQGATVVMSCLIRIERLYLAVNYIYLVTSPFRRLFRLTGESGVTQEHGQNCPAGLQSSNRYLNSRFIFQGKIPTVTSGV